MARLGGDKKTVVPPVVSATTPSSTTVVTNSIGPARQQVLLDSIAKVAAATGSGTDGRRRLFQKKQTQPPSAPTTTRHRLSTSQQYFAQRIEQSRQRALLANIDAAKAAATTTMVTLGGNKNNNNNAPTFVSADMNPWAVAKRRAYFSKRIAESRQWAQQRGGSTVTTGDGTMTPTATTLPSAAAVAKPESPKRFNPIKSKATSTTNDSAIVNNKADQTVQQDMSDMEAANPSANLGQADRLSTFSKLVADSDGIKQVAKPWTPNKAAAAVGAAQRDPTSKASPKAWAPKKPIDASKEEVQTIMTTGAFKSPKA